MVVPARGERSGGVIARKHIIHIFYMYTSKVSGDRAHFFFSSSVRPALTSLSGSFHCHCIFVYILYSASLLPFFLFFSPFLPSSLPPHSTSLSSNIYFILPLVFFSQPFSYAYPHLHHQHDCAKSNKALRFAHSKLLSNRPLFSSLGTKDRPPTLYPHTSRYKITFSRSNNPLG